MVRDAIVGNWQMIVGVISLIGACVLGVIAIIWRLFAWRYEGQIIGLTAQIGTQDKHLALLGDHIFALVEMGAEAKEKVETLGKSIRLGDSMQITANSALVSAVVTKLIAEGRGLAAHFVNPTDQSETPVVVQLAAEAETKPQ